MRFPIDAVLRNRERALRVSLRVALAALFVAAASYKIFHPLALFNALKALPITQHFPIWATKTAIGFLTGYEAFIGISLLFGLQTRVVALHAGALLVAFTCVTVPSFEALRQGCGCMWRSIPFQPSSISGFLLRNSAFVMLSVAIGVLEQRHWRNTLPLAGR